MLTCKAIKFLKSTRFFNNIDLNLASIHSKHLLYLTKRYRKCTDSTTLVFNDNILTLVKIGNIKNKFIIHQGGSRNKGKLHQSFAPRPPKPRTCYGSFHLKVLWLHMYAHVKFYYLLRWIRLPLFGIKLASFGSGSIRLEIVITV